jgi:antitoxin YefM
MTEIVTFTEFRGKLAHWLDRVTSDKTELHVTRQGAQSVVVIDATEWSSLTETLHLLTPGNREHLLASIAEAESGQVVEFDPTIPI